MSADILLSRLEHVRRSGDGWRADCPNGHAKARGSLAIKEANDGTVLLHCFACSDVHGILSAVGLEVADLFPERIKDTSPEARQRAREAFKRSAWAAATGVLSRETTVVLAAAGMLRQGQPLSTEDDARLTLAMQRIDDARGLLQ
jgi:hypothetical protein